MPRHNNVYIYDGKKFSSIKQLSEYTGVHEKTITARLKRGMWMFNYGWRYFLCTADRSNDTNKKII